TTATYTYDGSGLRVKKVAGSTTMVYVFSGTKVIAEYVNGSLSKEYIYAGAQLLATEEGSTTKYYHPDHLSVRVSTDAAGTVTGERGHYPFGESWYTSGVGDKWQFTSYERDAESGLDYAMFRYDSSRLGRFMTPDPLAGTILNPQSLNRYAYSGNDPVNRTDPLGLFHDWWHDQFAIWFSAEVGAHDIGGGGAGPGFWGLVFGTRDFHFWGYLWWSLPGNQDEIARFSFRYETYRRTGCDPAFPERCQGNGQEIDSKERAGEQACAQELVTKLFAKHIAPLFPGVGIDVNARVGANWKIRFAVTFTRAVHIPTDRFGRRPGLEFYQTGTLSVMEGDVDAWQLDGDVVSGFNHLFRQVLTEFFTGKAEKPCESLAAFDKNNSN
ncbi:MAG: RHS repeat-associated core domain-containing protein, partial [Terriglobia bacterium]